MPLGFGPPLWPYPPEWLGVRVTRQHDPVTKEMAVEVVFAILHYFRPIDT